MRFTVGEGLGDPTCRAAETLNGTVRDGGRHDATVSPEISTGNDTARRIPPLGVMVLGMHRSGTSATTRVINLMGVAVAEDSRLKRASNANAKGFWEVPELTELNDLVLARLGGWWSSPPPPDADFSSAAVGEDLRAEARTHFRAAHRTDQWLWKDPRNCLTLPFWVESLGVRPVVILVGRDPGEAAQSIAKRAGFSERLGLALWERYNRSALAAVAGMPVFGLRYADLLERREEVCDQLAAFLTDNGISATAPEPSALEDFLTPRLRTVAHGPGTLSDSQCDLHERLLRGTGAHGQFRAEELPPESPWVEELFADLRWARSGPENRLRVTRARAERTDRRLKKAQQKVDGERAQTDRLRRRLTAREATLTRRAERRLTAVIAAIRGRRGDR